MLERLTDLPEGVDGLRARGKVTTDDFESVARPLLEDARRQGRRVRLLYHLGPEFAGMTAGAARVNVRVGIEHLHDFERCAVVSDSAWVRKAARVVATIMPCPVEVFENEQWDEAVRWLTARPQATNLSHRKIPAHGVVVLEPGGPLRAEDFEELSDSLDPWISQRGRLNGVVVHARKFPGWENLGAFLRHMRFLRDHRDKARRLALAADTPLARLAPRLAKRLVDAEVKRFAYDELDQAIAWASGSEPRRLESVPSNGGREHAVSG